ncbi:Flp family type IVb pilin [Sphingosinicella sp. LY1275]|uniref:Flp family type IVb pilin n=1 Tax=Sphingosinicella sp. LY1275 TaxID=3095379 RepID=UPI002ADED161|nr:Flp family type IVb pilin [Sphingosinicella sp. LY1275]MEA1013109.1 Flp family type IVb pilin [Sphingosinicella sp. LY1275]
MVRRICKLLSDIRGATAIEYGLIVSLVVIAIIGAIVQVAGTTIGIWTDVSTNVTESSGRARGTN